MRIDTILTNEINFPDNDCALLLSGGVDSISVGFGIGRNIQTHNMRAKIYTWKLTCLTYDYEFKDKTHNFSIIPVFPIGDIWM